jgi:23S rRNA (guanine745-N1)-methyltransferase
LAPLHPAGPLVLACPTGHSFDVNRRGYVSLVAGSRRLIGDSPAMLDAREAFLGRGWYEDLSGALSSLVAAEGASMVLDIGCGTGYYLRGVLAALAASASTGGDPARPQLNALAVDLSAPAVARTVRSSADSAGATTGLVADVWSPLPIRDGAAEVILNVFAPRNPTEFHRVLAPGGLLAVVVPHQSHLRELRADGLALEVPENKSADLAAGLTGRFELEQSRDLSAVLSLAPDDVAALIGMGPSSHHRDGAPDLDATGPARTVTVAFQLLGFRRLA